MKSGGNVRHEVETKNNEMRKQKKLNVSKKKYEVDNEHPGENGTNGVEMKTKLHVVSGQAGGVKFQNWNAYSP